MLSIFPNIIAHWLGSDECQWARANEYRLLNTNNARRDKIFAQVFYARWR